MGATALLLSFLCIWTTGYIVNSYMESVIKQLNLPLDIQPIALSGVWGTLWGAEEKPEASATPESKPSQEIASDEPEDSQTDTPSSEVEGAQADPDSENTGDTPDSIDAGGALDGASPDPDTEAGIEDGDSLPVFNGQEAMGQLSDEQRQSLYAMVVSKLNQDQLSQLSDSLQGGLTSEELSQMEVMLKETLTEEEYSHMMEALQGETKTDSGTVSE
jgi:hypothetical protein